MAWRTLRILSTLVIRPLSGAWNVLGLGVSGAAVVLLWTFHHPLAAWMLFLIMLVLLLGVASYRLQHTLELAKVPRIVFDKDVYGRRHPYAIAWVQEIIDARGTLSDEKQQVRVAPDLMLTKVRNDSPLRRKEAEVEDAEVVLRFYSLPEWTLEVECDGRWYQNDPPKAGKSLDAIKRRRLPASGQDHEIEVVVKHAGFGGSYAASADLYLSSGMRNERLALSAGSYAVAVTVRGQNLADDVTKWFLVTNLPDGKVEFGVAPEDFEIRAGVDRAVGRA